MELLLLIGLIVLVVVIIGAVRKKSTLTRIQTQIAETEYRHKRQAQQAAPDRLARYTQLEKITALRDQGSLTQAEFDAEKRAILAATPPRIQAAAPTVDAASLDDDEIVQALAERGYQARPKRGDKWRITEPLGGDKICRSHEEWIEYANGILARR